MMLSTPIDRQRWMATLAQASLPDLEARLTKLPTLPEYSFLRPPEFGLVMVRGRAGGTGQQFNLGEMTVTRCVVQIDPTADSEAQAQGNAFDRLADEAPETIAGFGYVAGRSRRHAELAALCDALMQHPDWCDRVRTSAIEPLQAIAASKRRQQEQATAATRVNFFTMPRGES